MNKVILDLDVGNSYIKFRSPNGVTARIDCRHFGELGRRVCDSIERVRVVCVLEDARKLQLAEEINRQFSCDPEFAAPSMVCAGLENKYNSPDKLGADRWLAAVAAHQISKGGPCLVIDAGSALTIDTINDESAYLGGYIIPGLGIMQRSLREATGQIDCEIAHGLDRDYAIVPRNTEQAVHRGACFAVVACTKNAIEDFTARWPNGRVFITGGDGGAIAASLNRSNECFQDLVLDGLALALP